ncbi:MAG: hydroxymethylbilane synthase [Verrucomicrobiota bacterium]|nr:hydroxymethylbilane synthase [Verrucomicrobiota bacterium]
MHPAEEKSLRAIAVDWREDPTHRSGTRRPSDPSHTLKVGARSSPLSRAQVEEVRLLYPHVTFEPVWVETIGDRDLATSLRTLGKSDFFTRELDEMLLRGEIDIAVHSAKDLPEPLPSGLCIAALTKGLDPRDSLVFRKGESLETLPSGAWIATSSERREEAVRSLRSDLRFKDVRGPIAQRLALLQTGEADGVVIAEAALLRLGFHHLPRIYLPGPTTPGQGQLAIVCRIERRELFSPIFLQ